jgi:hypothetical protein
MRMALFLLWVIGYLYPEDIFKFLTMILLVEFGTEPTTLWMLNLHANHWTTKSFLAVITQVLSVSYFLIATNIIHENSEKYVSHQSSEDRIRANL